MSKNRKIHNYKSFILKQETIGKYGYDPDSLGKTSTKFIIAVCRYCGKPHDLRKGFFNRAGSACHKECRLKEQSIVGSPFKDPKVRKKAEETCLERYGAKRASVSGKIRDKISKTKSTKEYKDKVRKTVQERYGVDSVFQAEEVKRKIKETNLKKHGANHHMKSEQTRKKAKETVQERYGVDNVMQSEKIKQKAKETIQERYGVGNAMQDVNVANKSKLNFKKAVIKGSNDSYKLINILRGKDFWKEMAKQEKTLEQLCEKFNINYRSATHRLLQPEFKDKYYKLYHFPNQQTQNEILNIIKNWKIKVEYNDRKVISPLELDIFIPEKNVAIEYNGSYWHSEAVLDYKDAKIKHINKTKKCWEKGIDLIHIFEHTYLDKKDQILGYIKASLGINNRKIGARKCKITNDFIPTFIDKYHIQGSAHSKMYFNLDYKGEIIGSMTAGEHHERGGDRKACILNRLVFKDDVTVQGGASKLFKYFVRWAKQEGYKKIISWSDNTLGMGNIYKVLGFNLEQEHSPGYFYYDAKNRKYCTRQSRRKFNKNRPKGVIIREWNKQYGFYPIWDCGKRKWSFIID